ncbi:MAG: thermonuclease family protein [Sphingomonas bacterium]|nr:thermonuclease family protein [Sphingomonas bacterium]
MLLSLMLASLTPLPGPCTVTDGDTIRCAPARAGQKAERIRLLGIDAPELRGHCRRGRICAPGDPISSKASLVTAMRRGSLSIQRVGTDRYGRTLAMVSAGGTDLSCWQLARRQAIYKPRWDDGGRVKARCPNSI